METYSKKIEELEKEIDSLERKRSSIKYSSESYSTYFEESGERESYWTFMLPVHFVIFLFLTIFSVASFYAFVIIGYAIIREQILVPNSKINNVKYDSLTREIRIKTRNLDKLKSQDETRLRIQEIKDGSSFAPSDYKNIYVRSLLGSIGTENFKSDFKKFEEREIIREEREAVYEYNYNKNRKAGEIKADIREAEMGLMKSDKFSTNYYYYKDKIADLETKLLAR